MIKPLGSDRTDNIDNWISNMLNSAPLHRLSWWMMQWSGMRAWLGCSALILSFINFSSPTFFLVKARAPAVVTLVILFHFNPVLPMQFLTAWNKSLSVVVFFRDAKLRISSVSWKLASIPRINTNNCTVSCTSVFSPNASEYRKTACLYPEPD